MTSKSNHVCKVLCLVAAEDADVQDLLNSEAAKGYRLVSAMQLPNAVTRLILCATTHEAQREITTYQKGGKSRREGLRQSSTAQSSMAQGL